MRDGQHGAGTTLTEIFFHPLSLTQLRNDIAGHQSGSTVFANNAPIFDRHGAINPYLRALVV